MKELYQIFGSENSLDYDILVFVDEIPNVKESHLLCSYFNVELSKIYPSKEIDTNLGVLENGYITKVFKGTIDEVNNALFLTYNLHEQKYKNQIENLLNRDIFLKIIRTARVLLSFLSRTEYRLIVKEALKGDLIKKIDVLEKIDLSLITELGKNIQWEDYTKTMSSQLAQILSLLNGKELYTKTAFGNEYNELRCMLHRESCDLNVLEKYKKMFLLEVKNNYLPLMIEVDYLKENLKK